MLKNYRQILIFSLLYLFLVIINGFFVLKYGLRYKPFAVVLLLWGLLILIQLAALFVISRIFKNSMRAGQWTFFVITALFFILSIYINDSVDGNLLHVDRWSAMHVGIEALLNDEYPYTAIDHLGGRTSNLPALLFLGIPFYLLGDVGYLQSFTFLVFAYTIFQHFKNPVVRLSLLFLLISSPCYLYEIYVKSDLISNFILVLFFVIFSFKYLQQKNIDKPFLLGILTSFIFYTRLTAIIPLILVFFRSFFKWSLRSKILFIVAGFSTISLLTLIVFMHYPSFSILMEKNPFVLQNKQLPFMLSLLYILLPCILAFRVKNINRLLCYCVLLLSLPVLSALGLYMIEFGIWPAIHDSRFDLSYLNIITPFLIIYLGCILDKKTVFSIETKS